LPILAAQGGRVVLGLSGTQPLLRRLLTGQCGISQTVVEGEKFPPAHVQFLLDRLPAAFRASPQTLPGPIPYLVPDPKLAQAWQQRLNGERRLKVGLVWAGNPRHPRDHFRSIEPLLLAPLADVPGIRWISLQKLDAGSRANPLPDKFQATDWTAELNDLADTAALIANLDLVISVDTSIAHLAGAMGKPVWVPLQFSPDWRWMLHRPDSPWYPTMRLFRQKRLRDWVGPIAEINEALVTLVKRIT
jgi:ADP-heptose:LPS heptosyltransferase